VVEDVVKSSRSLSQSHLLIEFLVFSFFSTAPRDWPGKLSDSEMIYFASSGTLNLNQLERGPMPSVMAALPNIGGALCSTPQNLADAHY